MLKDLDKCEQMGNFSRDNKNYRREANGNKNKTKILKDSFKVGEFLWQDYYQLT